MWFLDKKIMIYVLAKGYKVIKKYNIYKNYTK